MAKVEYASAENLMRVGLLLVFAGLALLQGAFLGDTAMMYFWIAMIVLIFETFKMPFASNTNAVAAEAIMAATMVIGGVKALIMSMGKSFAAPHIFLIIFIIGALTICFGAYKRFFPSSGKR